MWAVIFSEAPLLGCGMVAVFIGRHLLRRGNNELRLPGKEFLRCRDHGIGRGLCHGRHRCGQCGDGDQEMSFHVSRLPFVLRQDPEKAAWARDRGPQRQKPHLFQVCYGPTKVVP